MINKQNDNDMNKQEKTSFRNYLPIMNVVAIGMLVSFILFTIVKKWEHQNQRIEFESRSKGYAHALESTMHDYTETLNFIGDFFNNSEQVTREEFSGVAMNAIARHPGIQALEWNPLVLNSERATYEGLAQEEGFENFMFTERTEDKELVRAAQRDEYVVVYYIEPLADNKPAFGYDIASNPTRLQAINKSFESGNMSATDRITLVQETGEQFGVLLLLPLYKQNVPLDTTEDRRKNRKGFVVEVLRLGDVIETAFKNFSDEGIDMYLYDVSADEANSFLYFRPSRIPGMTNHHPRKEEIQKGLYWSKTFDLADRQWHMLFSPSSFYVKSQQSWQALLVLSGSLLLTCFLAFFLRRKSVYTAEIEQHFHKNEQILQTTMDGFILADTGGNLREVNSSYCKMSGYTQEELLKMNVRDLEVTLSAEEINRRIRKMVEQGKDRFETRHRCKDGSIIDLDVSAVVMNSGEAPIVAAFVRDITEIKMSENTMREERNRAQKYLDIAGVMMATLDAEGTVTLVNQRGCEILGYREEDILGKNWFDCFLPARLKKEVYQVFLQLMAGDIIPVEYYENPVLIQGGEERIIAFHNAIIKNPAGEISGALFSGEDITERKKAEHIISTERQRLYALFDALPAFVYLQAPDYTIKFANRYYKEHFGETAGKLCYESLWGRNEPCEKCPTFKVFDAKKPQQWEWHGAPDGRIYEINDYPFTDADGSLLVLELGFDITRRKAAEKEQERLTAELMIKNKELEQVLYVTSHDLRSPLVNVEGYGRELEYSVKDLISSIDHADVPSGITDKITPIVKEDIPESLHYIRTSVSKMDMLLRGILSLSRLGRYKLTIAEIDMNAMMSDIVDSHRFKLNEMKIKTDISRLPHCKGDSSQINQVFSNLLDNAVKYTDPERPGVIHISGYTEKNQSVYCMADNGIGIAPDHQDKIFEIFHQLEPNRVKGEGMGLTIAHRIIERHKGKIWIESELGRGSRFFVSLPS